MGIAEWADMYDHTTEDYYTMGELWRKYGVHDTEQGALGIIWGRHKREILGAQAEMHENERKNKVFGVIEKEETAECWGEEYLITLDIGEQR
eukprot:6210665-Pleurochrysis_carterae.AAC.7